MGIKQKPNLNFENFLWSQGFEFVAGVDEAGVAPLAGPVVAAAVIFKPGINIRELQNVSDSKTLNSKERGRLKDLITICCLDFGIGIVEVDEIDELNIHRATRLAMRRAVEKLKKTTVLLIDGPFAIPEMKILQFAVVDGDAKIASISAASIIAKVTRDRIMAELHEQYPQYGLARHKGYPTKHHITQILEYGPTPMHRKSFLTKLLNQSV